MVQEAKFAALVLLLVPGLHVSDETILPCHWYDTDNRTRGIEMTSGWDSQMINSVQIVDPWQECKCRRGFEGRFSDMSSPNILRKGGVAAAPV